VGWRGEFATMTNHGRNQRQRGFALLFVLITLVSLSALAVSLTAARLTNHALIAKLGRYVRNSSLSEGGAARLLFAIKAPQDPLDNKVLEAGLVASRGMTYKIAVAQAQLSPSSSDMAILERYASQAGQEAAWPNLESQLIEARSTSNGSLPYETFVAEMAGTIAPSELAADITAWPHGGNIDLASASSRVKSAVTSAGFSLRSRTDSLSAGSPDNITLLSATAGNAEAPYTARRYIGVTPDGNIRLTSVLGLQAREFVPSSSP
jgi:hypothetical protein